MRKIFYPILFILLFLANVTKAQYVIIHDSTFQAFLQLKYPSCFNAEGMMDTTCSEILNETRLETSRFDSSIDGIQYFKGLDTLFVPGNGSLRVVPHLPDSLTFLSYVFCLQQLPVLPKTLKHLDCSQNGLQSLPELPNTLIFLSCSSNRLQSLPALPSSLKSLFCGNYLNWILGDNQIQTLPDLPENLEELDCSGNVLKSLPVLPTTLKALNCSDNKLTSLPALPALLTSLNCNSNLLSNLPALPTTLTFLQCNRNSLTSLVPLPPLLTFLNCSGNNIYCLPKLPDSLKYLYIDFNKVYCLPNYPANLVSVENSEPIPLGQTFYIIPLCSPVTNENHCTAFPIISGNVFYDNNSNGVKDAGELYTSNIKLNLSGSRYTFTNKNGYYEIGADVGNRTLSIHEPNNYKAVPASKNFSFINYDELATQDFALQPIKNVDSVTATIIPWWRWGARPGFQFPYAVNYSNVGTTTVSPLITVSFDSSLLVYDSSSNPAVINTGNKLILNESSFAPGKTGNFTTYFRIKTSAPLGDTLHCNVTATVSTAFATDSSSFVISGSRDPNDKAATPNLTPQQVLAGKAISYLVRFQNTGTDTAFNIVIADTLSDLLDVTSLQVSASSSPCKVTVDSNIVYFEFLNVLLPDSNVNNLGSNGYISFTVKPKSTVTDGSISNNAAIYFDYNAAVITNTAITTISDDAVPVKLISFTALKQQDGFTTLLYWVTANEINTKNFVIEQSNDGIHFNGVATVAAKGYSGGNYSYAASLQSVITFYRLKMIDVDGTYTYSNILAVSNTKENNDIIVLNNPASRSIQLKVNTTTLNNTSAKIISNNGTIVKVFTLKQGVQQIDIHDLATGNYYIKTQRGIIKITIAR